MKKSQNIKTSVSGAKTSASEAHASFPEAETFAPGAKTSASEAHASAPETHARTPEAEASPETTAASVRIREMTIDDLEQVMPIEEANFSVPWTKNGFFTYLIRDDALFLVAEEAGCILGYCGVIMVPDEGDITNVSVDARRRGEGIGRLLVEELIRKAEQHGVTKLFLEVRVSNEAAIRLYQRQGFVKEGIRMNYYEEPKEDALIMSRGRITEDYKK